MKKSVIKQLFVFCFCVMFAASEVFSQNIFSVNGNKTYLNGKEFQSIGLRCSNALLSNNSVDQLIQNLDEYKHYGMNTISVYFMGSRYSNIYGYNIDGTLNETYKNRMAKIIEACDEREIVVLVGILYWGSGMAENKNDFYAEWGQEDVNKAIQNTIKWLKENNYLNVFIDPDNEGMAERGAGFNIDEMICKAKEIDENIPVAYNGRGYPPPCADLSIHFGFTTQDLPYIETEGTPSNYWGDYSKEPGGDSYINVGLYTDRKKAMQLRRTKQLLDEGHGYLFASTWLQNVPPNYHLGGDGTGCDPGIKWWMDFIKENYKQD